MEGGSAGKAAAPQEHGLQAPLSTFPASSLSVLARVSVPSAAFARVGACWRAFASVCACLRSSSRRACRSTCCRMEQTWKRLARAVGLRAATPEAPPPPEPVPQPDSPPPRPSRTKAVPGGERAGSKRARSASTGPTARRAAGETRQLLESARAASREEENQGEKTLSLEAHASGKVSGYGVALALRQTGLQPLTLHYNHVIVV